jgi:hypothetical protein
MRHVQAEQPSLVQVLGQRHEPVRPCRRLVPAARPVVGKHVLPKPGATVTSIEFGFTGATTLRVGQIVRWANAGFLVHMIVGAQAPNLATANKIAALLKAGKDTAAQALAIGSFSFDGALSHGESFESVISQKPGFWVIACFMNTQDGREHTTLGMEKVIQILK